MFMACLLYIKFNFSDEVLQYEQQNCIVNAKCCVRVTIRKCVMQTAMHRIYVSMDEWGAKGCERRSLRDETKVCKRNAITKF